MTVALRSATVDLVARLVHREDADDPVRLTRTEARLLAYFIDNPNRLLTQEQLLVDVWELHPKTRTATVYVTVNRLRKKIERDPKQPAHVTNSPGAGYLFRPLAVVASDPSRMGPLVGRAAELQRLGNAARRSGVVVVRGPAGVGKTRLVEAFLAGRRNPSWRVALGETSDANGLISAVARALGVQPGPSVDASLSSVLASLERSTLVLDDVDRAALALPAVLNAWTSAAPDLRVVVTTRRRIASVEAHAKVLVLEPLDASSAAVLLRERSPEPLDDAAVERQVSELGGNPLAIEIAARSGGAADAPDALHLLPGDRLDRALRTSWELLVPEQQTLLAAVAGFQAPFTLEAAAAVIDRPSADVAAGLQGLVDHGLAAPAALSDSPRPRLSLPSPVRAFAHEQSVAPGMREMWSRRHALWFAGADPGPWSTEVRDDRRVEQPDREQAESVLGRLLGQADPAGATPIAEALVDLVVHQVEAALRLGPIEPLVDRVASLLEVHTWRPDLHASLVHGRARLLGVLGRYDEAITRLTETLDAHPGLDRRWRATLLRERGHHRSLAFALDGAEQDLQQALSTFRDLDSPAEMGRCATVLGIVAFNRGDRESASRWLEQAVQQLEEPDPEGWAQAATRLAMVVQQHGDAVRARQLLADVMVHCETVGDAYAGMTARAALAICLVGAGDRRGGVAMHEQVLGRARRLGDLHREASTRYNLGSLLAADDEVEPARVHLGRALALFEQLGNQRSIALTRSALGTLERSEENVEAARAHLEPGLALALEGGWKGLVVSMASSLALVAARDGDDEAVAQHLAVASDANEGLNMPFVSASLCCRRAIIAYWGGDDETAARWVAAAEVYAEQAGKRESTKFAGMLGAVEQARVDRR